MKMKFTSSYLFLMFILSCISGSTLGNKQSLMSTDAEELYDDESTLINENYDDALNHLIRHRHNHHHHKDKTSHSDLDKRWRKGGHNFMIVDYLSDGEMERRISYDGLIAKETSLGNNSHSITLWQLTDGKAFYQAIFNGDHQLLDCEYVRQREIVRHFINKFNLEIDQARSRNRSSPYIRPKHKVHLSDHQFREYVETGYLSEETDDFDRSFGISMPFDEEVSSAGLRNLSYHKINHDYDLPTDLRQWMNVKDLRVQCNKRHQQLKEMALKMQSNDESERLEGEEQLNRQKRALSDWLLAPNTKWCGRGTAAEKYSELGGNSRADMCCRKHDHCKFTIKGMSTKWSLFNFRPYTLSHCSCDLRKRRDLSSLLRIPGTKWCGAGWSAKKYTDMGGLSRADRCCRQHDTACQYWILGMETKYGLFNWRVGTLMHCSCDERFRTCLKMADSSDANMVGRVFFNVLQTKCFVLKPEKVCKERSWWGKCVKKGIRKRAHIRDNRKF